MSNQTFSCVNLPHDSETFIHVNCRPFLFRNETANFPTRRLTSVHYITGGMIQNPCGIKREQTLANLKIDFPIVSVFFGRRPSACRRSVPQSRRRRSNTTATGQTERVCLTWTERKGISTCQGHPAKVHPKDSGA